MPENEQIGIETYDCGVVRLFVYDTVSVRDSSSKPRLKFLIFPSLLRCNAHARFSVLNRSKILKLSPTTVHCIVARAAKFLFLKLLSLVFASHGGGKTALCLYAVWQIRECKTAEGSR